MHKISLCADIEPTNIDAKNQSATTAEYQKKIG